MQSGTSNVMENHQTLRARREANLFAGFFMYCVQKADGVKSAHRVSVQYKKLLALLLLMFVVSCGGGKDEDTPPAQGNTVLPSAATLSPPQLITPSTMDYRSNTTVLTIIGTCTVAAGSTINLGGDGNLSTSCASNGTFTFLLTQTNDGIYRYTLNETNLVNHPSDKSLFVWRRSTVAPNAPVITSNNPSSSTANSITVAGTCVPGNTVNLTGDSTGEDTCSAGGTFGILVYKDANGNYQFYLKQTDSYGNQSSSATAAWNRNLTAPNPPVLVSPATNPFSSSSTNLTLSGTCANGTIVKLAGQLTDSYNCTAGTFTFSLNETQAGTYNYSLYATSSGGVNSTSISFQWILNLGLPATPTITSPSLNPYYSNGSSVVVAGTCTGTNLVFVRDVGSGVVEPGVTCSAGTFSVTVSKAAEGTFNLGVKQRDQFSQDSAEATVTWVRDESAPIAPILTTPVSPYTSSNESLVLSGTCEPNAVVNVAGDATPYANCTAGSFSITITKTANTTYNFTLSQTDRAGNTSASIPFEWTLDTAPPSAPTITTPSVSPFYSKESTLTIEGGCETGAIVKLTDGTNTQQFTCTASAYSFTINNQTVDGTYNFSLNQKDAAQQTSSSVALQWVRDTVAPGAPTITSPTSNPLTANADTVIVGFDCEAGATVNYSGVLNGSKTCAAGTDSVTINKTLDGTYSLTFTQTDPAGNTSVSSSFSWTRISTGPATPVITTPSTTPHYTSALNLTIQGTCQTGNVVTLAGILTQYFTCANSAFTFSVIAPSAGTYNLTVIQTNGASLSSSAANLQWIVDTTAPNLLTVTNPVGAVAINSSSSLTIAGTCEANASIAYTGSLSGPATCSSTGTFSFAVSNNVDGFYTFNLTQTDLAGNTSGSTVVNWTRDTLPPAKPTLSQPSTNPLTSGDSTITISGSCETNATVSISGSSITDPPVLCSALNTFSFSASKGADGTYAYSLIQTDLAGNVSASTDLTWVRDTSIPFTPVVTVPSSLSYYSKTTSLDVTVTCNPTISAIVHLTGVTAAEVISPLGTLDQTCSTGSVSYTVQKTVDGTYSLNFSQENSSTGALSAEVVLSWTLDRVAPAAPVILKPSTSPYSAPGELTLSGSCEPSAQVYLTGDLTTDKTCVGGIFEFLISKSPDATYNFSVTQTDLAGNTSTADTQTWVRDVNAVPVPTILAPTTASTYASSGSSLVISGGCMDGYTVVLGGSVTTSDVTDPAGSLTQVCPNSQSYSFTIQKSVDGVFALSLLQSYAGFNSSPVGLTWTRDATAPSVTGLATTSGNPNLTTSITFTFSSNEAGVTYQCSLNGAAAQSCSSPLTYTNLVNGTGRTVTVTATDAVGNVGTAATYTWEQKAYNTIALYQMSNTNDSGLFTDGVTINNNLTANGSPTSSTGGAFGNRYTLGLNKYFSVASNATFQSGKTTMSVEGFFNLSSLHTGVGDYVVLFSQTGAASPDLGWELRLRRGLTTGKCKDKYYFDFVGSTTGSAQTTIVSSCNAISTATWYYVSVTWSSGTVNVYMKAGTGAATKVATGTISGTSLFINNTTPFRIGASATTNGTAPKVWLTGSVDMVRVSNIIRPASFPTAAYTAD